MKATWLLGMAMMSTGAHAATREETIDAWMRDYTGQVPGASVLVLEDGDAVFRVMDRGMGVPAEVQKQLFGKFFRAENARKQRPDGTGIGLYLAKKVIDGHSGKLVFESVENKGSTFGFRLPIKKLSKPPLPAEDETKNTP